MRKCRENAENRWTENKNDKNNGGNTRQTWWEMVIEGRKCWEMVKMVMTGTCRFLTCDSCWEKWPSQYPIVPIFPPSPIDPDICDVNYPIKCISQYLGIFFSKFQAVNYDFMMQIFGREIFHDQQQDGPLLGSSTQDTNSRRWGDLRWARWRSAGDPQKRHLELVDIHISRKNNHFISWA